MLCEKCKKRTATVFYNENINGKTRAYSLCGECAAKLREKGDLQDITSMMSSFADPFSAMHDELFGGFFGMPAVKAISAQKKCDFCGSTYAQIAKDGKAGCPSCYTTFREELKPSLRSLHGGNLTHAGRAPADRRAKKERSDRLESLKMQLAEAISTENFEKAAGLRDEIRALEKE